MHCWLKLGSALYLLIRVLLHLGLRDEKSVLGKEGVEYRQQARAPATTFRSQPPCSLKMAQAQTWGVLSIPIPAVSMWGKSLGLGLGRRSC